MFIFLSGCAASGIKNAYDHSKSTAVQFGINESRDFFIDSLIPDTFTARWRSETNGNLGFNSVVTTEKAVFVSDLSGRIYSFNRQTGKRIGYLRYKGSIQCAPLIYKNIVIFPLVKLNQNQTLLIFYDYDKGTELYKIEIEGKVLSVPVLADDMVFCLTTEGSVIKTNFRGDIIWTKKLKLRNNSNLFLEKNYLLFGTDSGELIYFNYKTGETELKISLSGSPLGNLSVKDGAIITSDYTGTVYVVKDEILQWTFNSGGRIDSYISSDLKRVYFGTLNGDIFCLDLLTGKLLWQHNYGGVINAAPLVTGNFLLYPNLDRKIFIVEKNSGQVIKVLNFDGRVRLTPVIDNGQLFVGYDNYFLEAYDLP